MKTIILPFQLKKDQVISLSRLKDMIRYSHLVKFSLMTPNHEVVNILSVNPLDHNYWPYPNPIVKQSGYCSCSIPLFNAY